MDFRILGPIEVSNEGQQLRLGGPRQRALLAYLLLREGDVVQVSRLLEELWHNPPSGGVGAVHSHVSRLRRIVGDRIATVGNGYAMRLGADDGFDLRDLRALLAEAGAAAEPDERARLLGRADALWHGTPFDDLDVPFVATETVALEELRIAATEERIEAELQAGRDGDLVGELATLVTRYPLRERLRRQWMLALYRSGRQADALEAYRATRRMFDEELGLAPSPALAELERAILQHDPSLDAPRKPPRVIGPVRRRRRPAAVAALIAAGAAVTIAGVATAVVISDRGHRTSTVNAAAPIADLVAQPKKRVVHHQRKQARPRHHTVPVAEPKPAPAVTIATTTVAVPAAPVQVTTTTATAKRRVVTTPKAAPRTTTKAKEKTKTVPPPAPVTIADDFNGTSVDPLIWYQVAEGTGWTMSEQDGHLEFSFQPGTTSDPRDGVYGGHVATLCKFPGDFDARVDFSLAQWPASNDMSVVLWAFMGPRPDPWSATRSSTGPESYGAFTGTWISVPDSDVTGALRVSRHAGRFTASFLHAGRWVTIASASNSSLAAIGVGAVGGDAKSTPFNGQPVIIDFDNFKVSGVHPLCPPGSPLG